MVMKNILVLFLCIHPAVSFCDSGVNERLDDIEDTLEYEIHRNPKQDMLEVLNETGFMIIAKRVEDKLEVSNRALAEGNALMRSMIERIDKKDRKDEKQDELIRLNDSRITSNKSKIWAISMIISLVFSAMMWLFKIVKDKKNKETGNKIIIYKR